MNFQDLLAKMKQIEEGAVEECGGMPMPPMGAPKQQDSVTMNVTMNGSGTGGIKDLLGIIRNIEGGADHDHGMGDKDAGVLVGVGEEFANEPDAKVAGIDAVLPTGDDLASKGAEAEKVNGGGNPMGVDESLIQKLSSLYNEVKSR